MRNSEEALLRKVGDSKVVNISKAVDPKGWRMNGSRKEFMGIMREKRKVLTGIELGSGLQKEI